MPDNKIQTTVCGFDTRGFIIGSTRASGEKVFIGDKSMSLSDQAASFATFEQRHALIAEARSWIRTPFVNNASKKGIGVACGPLMIECFKAVGFPAVTPPWARFPKDWHLHTKEERYYNVIAQYTHPVEKPLPADVVLFRFNRMDKPARPFCHGGIVVEWPVIIHAYWGKSVEEIDVSTSPLMVREHVFLSPWA